jgi:uncharacterized membrane protein YjjP (DUF1212 family)
MSGYAEHDEAREDYRLLMEAAVLAGEIMLESGAETYRVEDTIYHFLKTSQLEHTQAFATGTGIVATLSDHSVDPVTVVRRVQRRQTNLYRIYLVNGISRRFADGELDLSEAHQELKAARTAKQYSWRRSDIGVVLISAFFTIMLGGKALDGLISAVLGGALAFLIHIGRKVGIPGFLMDGLNSAIIVFCALLIGHWIPAVLNTDLVIIGGIMPMVPGVAVTNAVRDTLQQDYVSGGARMMEASMEAVAIALGACAGMGVFWSCI